MGGRNGILFLPQRPYITQGTLRDQIIFPHSLSECTASDNELLELLEQLELRYLADDGDNGLDTVSLWQDMLSGGEQQRVGFARLFYHK